MYTYAYLYVRSYNSSVWESMVLYGDTGLYMLSEGTDVCVVTSEKKVNELLWHQGRVGSWIGISLNANLDEGSGAGVLSRLSGGAA